jgi:hypothetical protein
MEMQSQNLVDGARGDRRFDAVSAVKKGRPMKRMSSRLSLALALLTLVGFISEPIKAQ